MTLDAARETESAASVGCCRNSLADLASRDDGYRNKAFAIYICTRLPSLSTKPLLPYEP